MAFDPVAPVSRTPTKTQSVTVTFQFSLEKDPETGVETVAKSYKGQRVVLDQNGEVLGTQQKPLEGVVSPTVMAQIVSFMTNLWNSAQITP